MLYLAVTIITIITFAVGFACGVRSAAKASGALIDNLTVAGYIVAGALDLSPQQIVDEARRNAASFHERHMGMVARRTRLVLDAEGIKSLVAEMGVKHDADTDDTDETGSR